MGNQLDVAARRMPKKSSSADRAAKRAILKEYGSKRELNTIDAIASRLGVSRTALYGMTTGDTERYSEDTLRSVLEKIGCSRAKWDAKPKRITRA